MTGRGGIGRTAVTFVGGVKPCSRCGEIKPVSGFYKDSSMVSGYSGTCKTCRKSGSTPVDRKDSVLFTKYGIRQSDYNEMFIEQEGRCLICNIYQAVLCVDHDHVTKKVRGLICRECNFGLGKFADDPDRLMAAAAYLLSHRSDA